MKEDAKQAAFMALPVWYVKFPTYQYVEDVAALAVANRLRVVNARFQNGAEQCENPPSLTLKEKPKAPGAVEVNKDIVRYFAKNELEEKPLVRDVENDLGIDTNGKEIEASWKFYKEALELFTGDDE